jgi:hypothetical protein
MMMYEGMEKPEEAPVPVMQDGVVQGYFWNLLAVAFGDGKLFPTKDAAYQEKIRQLEAKVSILHWELAEAKKPVPLRKRLSGWYHAHIADTDPMG